MRGSGSGKWFRRIKKLYLDDCRNIDLNRMRELDAIPDCGKKTGTWLWTSRETGEVESKLGFEADTRDPSNLFLMFSYTLRDERKDVNYTIRLATTTQHYGGKRFWFVCPSTGRRVTKLYLYDGRFVSRHACGLAYQCQSENFVFRLARKQSKITKGEWLPVRSKGMHKKTYERIYRAFIDLEMAMESCFPEHWRDLL